ncbi:DUF2929 family protein [Neobacillus notoginsengisoli]|uniref:DUF2929 family protein n=1 Tax=Neobacillus notoginsengisoli TaxID=1578198 RepID=A0A417YZ62_9BACI|nr:YjzD family protein [Neobacillus notoginsengisoli]RHW43203.1 DUF2929 family protein [Neobacillus notoginsengisoli]
MRYFWTFFWVLLLVEMLSYVVTSMIGANFDYKVAALLGVLATILILIAPAILPNDSADQH